MMKNITINKMKTNRSIAIPGFAMCVALVLAICGGNQPVSAAPDTGYQTRWKRRFNKLQKDILSTIETSDDSMFIEQLDDLIALGQRAEFSSLDAALGHTDGKAFGRLNNLSGTHRNAIFNFLESDEISSKIRSIPEESADLLESQQEFVNILKSKLPPKLTGAEKNQVRSLRAEIADLESEGGELRKHILDDLVITLPESAITEKTREYFEKIEKAGLKAAEKAKKEKKEPKEFPQLLTVDGNVQFKLHDDNELLKHVLQQLSKQEDRIEVEATVMNALEKLTPFNDKLANKRNQLASLLGKDNYSHVQLQEEGETPQNILDRVKNDTDHKRRVRAEVDKAHQILKDAETAHKSTPGKISYGDMQRAIYLAQQKQIKVAAAEKSAVDESAAFPIDETLSNLFKLIEELTDLKLDTEGFSEAVSSPDKRGKIRASIKGERKGVIAVDSGNAYQSDAATYSLRHRSDNDKHATDAISTIYLARGRFKDGKMTYKDLVAFVEKLGVACTAMLAELPDQRGFFKHSGSSNLLSKVFRNLIHNPEVLAQVAGSELTEHDAKKIIEGNELFPALAREFQLGQHLVAVGLHHREPNSDANPTKRSIQLIKDHTVLGHPHDNALGLAYPNRYGHNFTPHASGGIMSVIEEAQTLADLLADKLDLSRNKTGYKTAWKELTGQIRRHGTHESLVRDVGKHQPFRAARPQRPQARTATY